MKKQQSSTGREYWYGKPTSLKDTETYFDKRKCKENFDEAKLI
jgi:hypothetical protein